jgi:hypothetical protein
MSLVQESPAAWHTLYRCWGPLGCSGLRADCLGISQRQAARGEGKEGMTVPTPAEAGERLPGMQVRNLAPLRGRARSWRRDVH